MTISYLVFKIILYHTIICPKYKILMRAELPNPIKEAITIAPTDPLYDGPKDNRVSLYVNTTVNSWKKANDQFGNDFANWEKIFSPEDLNAIKFYLASSAITLAGFKDYPQTYESKVEEARAGITLFQHLTDGSTQKEQEAYLKTRDVIFQREPSGITLSIPPEFRSVPEEPKDLEEKLRIIKSKLRGKFDAWKKADFVPEMRDILAYYTDIRNEHPVESRYLFDLAIGDINLRSETIEDEFKDLPERLGLEGVKFERIEQRKTEYDVLLKRAGVNLTGYQTKPIGWEGLIQRGEEYLNYFGLGGYRQEGRFIAMGGSDAMQLALMTARAFLKDEQKDVNFDPEVIFPTPGFMMMKDVAEELKMKAVELKTRPEQNFLPDPDNLRELLKNNPKAKIIVLTPINNPGSHIADIDQMKKIMDVLDEPEFKDIVVINDFAYLGTGETEENQGLGEVLNRRKRRIDILAWTKLIGQPGLRCATGATPDEGIAKFVIPEAKNKVYAISYAMQVQAMATLDFVKFEDMHRLTELYMYRQRKLIELLKKRSDLFDFENKPITYWDAALYAFVPIKEGLDPLDVIVQTGLFGTPAGAFYFDRLDPSIPKYIRFAVGITPLTEEIIARMAFMMKVANPKD